MIDDLPDMDEPISFAVDNGAQAGPYTMREIIESVRNGQRASNTLVWWAGQPDWVAFDSVPGLLSHIELDAKPPPPAEDDPVADGGFASETETLATDDPFAGSSDYTFGDVDTEPADGGDSDAEGSEVYADTTVIDTSEIADADADTDTDTDTDIDIDIDADAGSDMVEEPHVESPDEWRDLSETASEPTETISQDTFGSESFESTESFESSGSFESAGSDSVIAEDQPAGESYESEVDDLSEEFGGSGLFGDGPAQPVEESTTLQSVSERIEALGAETPTAAAGGLFSTTRRLIGRSDPADAQAEDAVGESGRETVGSAAVDTATDDTVAEHTSVQETSVDADQEVPASEPAETDVGGHVDEFAPAADDSTSAISDSGDDWSEPVDIFSDAEDGFDDLDEFASVSTADPELDELFTSMVAESHSRHLEFDWASKLDDVALGAVISSTLGNGYSLIDLHSLAQSHQARFEHPESRERIIVEIDTLGPASAGGALLGHHAYVTVGLGRPLVDETMIEEDELFDAPGTISVEADLASGYAYSTVDLIWQFDELLDANRALDTDAVDIRVAAALQALRQHWTERFGTADD